MEIPDGSSWIDHPLLPDQDQHALYATDLPPLNQQQQEQASLYEQSLQQALSFDDSALQHADFHHCPELQQQHQQQQFSQPEHPGSRAGANECLASTKRVNKADREKLRRDKLNEQFTELASALDPDRPKIDKATILSDSVQELNELRAEVKRLKAEQAALLDESRDLTHEKSELREEKALLKTETEQLNSQLQQRLRLALSWTMDPSLMMGATAFPYPVPVPAPPPAEASAASPAPGTLSSTSSSSSSTTSTSSSPAANCMLPPVMQHSPFAMPLPPFGMHPYAMFANRPPGGGNMPFYPYFAAPHSMVGPANSTVERPFPHYPLQMLRGYPGPETHQLFQPDASYKPMFGAPVATKVRDENAEQVTEPQPQADSEVSNPSQAEGSSLEVKQEIQQSQLFVKTLSPIREGSGSPSIQPTAA